MSPTPRHPQPRFAAALPARAAFTLIELLTVIAIIGILAAILIPTVGKIRSSAMASKCVSNLRQIGGAFQLYANDNRGLFPAPRQATSDQPSSNQNPLGGSWQLELARYTSPKLRADNLYRLKETGDGTNAAYCPSYAQLFTDTTAILATNLNCLGYGMNFNLNVNGVTLNTNARRVTRFPATGIVNPSRQVLVGDSSDYMLDVKTTGWVFLNDAAHPDGYNAAAPTRHGNNAKYLFADGHVETIAPAAALVLLPFQP